MDKKLEKWMAETVKKFPEGFPDTTRVNITTSKGEKIGFDLEPEVKLSDALRSIATVMDMDDAGELKEIDLAEEEKDMPRIHIEDFLKTDK